MISKKKNLRFEKKKKMIYISVDEWRFVISIKNLDNKNFGMF